MSLGDAIRGLIDPIDPAVRDWLHRELPRLVTDGYIEEAQADLIARRYGVRLDPGKPGQVPADDERREASLMPASQAAPPATGPAPGTAMPQGVSPPREQAAPATGRASSPFLADHAVSIVLYLGAFLVVAAVVIFLAYSWGDISDGAKLTALALLTTGFLGAAWLCLPRPSVRPAGRTFLALGTILVPANVAATYLVYFEGSPIPGAVFWLLGALISGGLYAALSLRLGSRVYGGMATLAVPVAACALAWLIVPERPALDSAWVLGPAAAAGLAATLAAVHWSPPVPLVQATRAVASLLLPLAFLISLPFVEEPDVGQFGTPAALLLMIGGLAWEAMRGGRTWWIGAVAALLAALPLAIWLAVAGHRSVFVDAIVLSSLVTALAARRLPRQRRILWDVAAILPALVYPFAAWDDDRACIQLFAGLALVSAIVARGWRSSAPLYAAVIAVIGTYVKLLAIYGSPDSPAWALGAALWPLGGLWALLGTALPRRVSGPAWLGALVSLLAAMPITWDQPDWCAGIAATGAAATVVAAWRLGLAPALLLAVPWLLVAGYQGADLLRLELPWRFVAAGVTGWLLFAASLLRPPPESVLSGAPAVRGSDRSADPGEPRAPGSETGGHSATGASHTAARRDPETPVGGTGRVRLLAGQPPALAWALMARCGAVVVAGIAATLLLFGVGEGDTWLEAATAGWLNAALVLAAWAVLGRSRDIAVLAALSVVPALFTGIGRTHPTDGQAYALPIGLYLLGVAMATRRDRRPGRAAAASTIGAVGLLVLLGTGVVQSLDGDRFGHALLTLAESLALVGIGIAIRWRLLVVGGVAGTVAIAVRQLFDAVAALPGWAILGGSGMLLLGIAVALLLARARLAAAGRSVAERWSTWD